MYKLTISGHSKSKAKLLGRRTKHFIVGQEFEIYFEVKNVGGEPSPPTIFYYTINWPGTKAETVENFKIKSIESGQSEKSETATYRALSTGLGGVTVYANTDQHPIDKVQVWEKEGEIPQRLTKMFELIYATTPEAIYEFWALWVYLQSVYS